MNMDIRLDNAEMLNTKIDYLASRYAVSTGRIENDLILNSAIEELATSFKKTIGAFYDEFGYAGAGKEMLESLLTGIVDRIKEYQDHLSWVGNAYMAARLRESMNSENGTLRDLGVAAVAAQDMNNLRNAPPHTRDEQIMQLITKVNQSKISGKMADLINNCAGSYLNTSA